MCKLAHVLIVKLGVRTTQNNPRWRRPSVVRYLSSFPSWQTDQLSLGLKALAIGCLLDWKATAQAWRRAARPFIFLLEGLSFVGNSKLNMSNCIIELKGAAEETVYIML